MKKEKKIILSDDEYHAIVKKLAKEINQYYEGNKKIVLIGLLRGCYMFFSDLSKLLKPACIIDFMMVTRYGGKRKGTRPTIRLDIDVDIENKHVLIVDDCSDEGITLDFVCKTLAVRNPTQIDVCVLFDKPSNRAHNIDLKIRFVGKKLGPEFIAGCGLDEKDQDGDPINRNIEGVWICEPEENERNESE